MTIFRDAKGNELYEATDLPPALPVAQPAPSGPDLGPLFEAMKIHRLHRTGANGLYHNRHLLPEPFNTMGRDRLHALTARSSASRQTMRSITRHISAAQRMLDDMRGELACPAYRGLCVQ